MKKITIVAFAIFITTTHLLSQSVGIAKEEFIPHASAALEIKSSEKGLLIPRLSEQERVTISGPATGLIVFQTNQTKGFYYFNGNDWFLLKDSASDMDSDPSNELQSISLSGDTLKLTNGGNIILPATSSGSDKQTLSINGDSLSISNGNYVVLNSVKDNLGTHRAERNVQMQGYYISSDGDNEGVLINPNGDVSIGNNFNVSGTTTTLNLNTTGTVNLGANAIQSDEIAVSAVTTSKIGDSQVTGEKIHPMGASTDQYLQYNGSEWVPADMPGGLNYLGTWDASQNQPYITNAIGNNSDYYVVSTGGSQNLGSGNINFSTSDWVIHNGTAWEKINNSSDVNSVFGRTGTIQAQFGDYTWNLVDKSTSSVDDIGDISITGQSTGQVLISSGSQWVNNSISGDISLNSSGNMQINPGAILYNDIQDASGGANSILVWNGTNWSESVFSSLEQDGSTTNELQALSLVTNSLTLSGDPTPVDLSGYLDNTDGQNLSLSGNTLSLTNDVSTVSLTPFLDNTDEQTLSFTSPNLTISGGNSVDLSALSVAGSDDQTLSLSLDTLSIENGNSINLSGYLDNTDNQDLTLTTNILSLTNDGTTVDLAPYLDNTDAQSLTFMSPNLTISGGNSVDLSALSTVNTDDQNIRLVIDSLVIENGNSVSLQKYLDNTDNQDLTGATLIGTNLQIDIENGSSTSVDLAPLQDGTTDADADASNELITNAQLVGNNLQITDAGQTWSVDLTPIASPSDIRLKKNLTKTRFGITDVLSLNVMDYDFKTGASNQTGFLAQDLHKLYPMAVRVGGDDASKDPWGVKYGMLTPLLTKAIQDLYWQLVTLDNSNKELQQENARIREELNQSASHEQRIKKLERRIEQLINNK